MTQVDVLPDFLSFQFVVFLLNKNKNKWKNRICCFQISATVHKLVYLRSKKDCFSETPKLTFLPDSLSPGKALRATGAWGTASGLVGLLFRVTQIYFSTLIFFSYLIPRGVWVIAAVWRGCCNRLKFIGLFLLHWKLPWGSCRVLISFVPFFPLFVKKSWIYRFISKDTSP